jgi:hypothetical protein
VNSGDAVSVLDTSWCKPGWGEGERIVRTMCYVAPRRKGDGGVFKGMGCALDGRARGGLRNCWLGHCALRATRGRRVEGAVLPPFPGG